MVGAFLGHSNVLRWLIGQDAPPHLSNTLMNVAGWVWRWYVMGWKRPPLYSPGIPLLAIPGIGRIAGKHELAAWSMKGIQTIGDIFEEGHFLTYEALANVHDLGQGGVIACGALHRLVHDTWGNGNSEPQTTPVLHELLTGAGIQSDISWIYKTLHACPEEAQTWAKASDVGHGRERRSVALGSRSSERERRSPARHAVVVPTGVRGPGERLPRRTSIVRNLLPATCKPCNLAAGEEEGGITSNANGPVLATTAWERP
ncbi:hypothetical protein NDU88_001032 [Pleurodeles waltl]|uniref:Uncharacterized protein n=1 Tax=Pleurodeles waltl TaxID=8319 RepID=A0AAV7L8H7_PLEWA|nr:hypothetical protein NDU88_001032 [Pleurodeles waltl]